MTAWKHSLVALLVACSGGRREVAQPTTPTHDAAAPAVDVEPDVEIPGVALAVTPASAVVEIDDVERGPASSLGIVPLEPGVHYVVITEDGYKPYRVEFVVKDRTERLTVRLEKAR